jgi:hypothetical protein
MLDIWPALPIVVRVHGEGDEISDNVLAALERHDRVVRVGIVQVSGGEIEELAGAMQVTFPALTHLHIDAFDFDTASFPDTLLGGSAPNLRSLRLACIAFTALPKLLLSSPGLVFLTLIDIPYSEHISSAAMVDCLSSLTRLEHLQIEFPHSQPRPDGASRRPPPLTPTVFPVLGTLILKGVTEYLDQLLAHMEAPHLDDVRFEFLDPPNFDVSRFPSYIGLTETFEGLDQAHMRFGVDIRVVLSSRKETTGSKGLILSLLWEDPGWKLAKLACEACLPSSYPSIFYLSDSSSLPRWTIDMGITPWLDFLRVFTAVETLYLSAGVALCIGPALRELGGQGATELLPALQTIFIETSWFSPVSVIQEVMGGVVTVRELFSRPAAVSIEQLDSSSDSDWDVDE